MANMRDILYSLGQADARDLRARAIHMDGTGIIQEEAKIPNWDPAKDYTGWPIGSPVQDGGQVWVLLQPYNAAEHPQHPAEIRAHWGLCHTEDPARAKPWVDAAGQSGLYYQGECYKDAGGQVWRCLWETTSFPASALPEAWEKA